MSYMFYYNIVHKWLLLFYFPFFILWNVSFLLTNLVLFLPFDFLTYCMGNQKTPILLLFSLGYFISNFVITSLDVMFFVVILFGLLLSLLDFWVYSFYEIGKFFWSLITHIFSYSSFLPLQYMYFSRIAETSFPEYCFHVHFSLYSVFIPFAVPNLVLCQLFFKNHIYLVFTYTI